MQNTTPLFPGFHLPTLRRTPRSDRQKAVDELAKIKQKSFSEIAEYLAQINKDRHSEHWGQIEEHWGQSRMALN